MSSSAKPNRGNPARLLVKARAPVSYACSFMLLWACGFASYNIAVAAPVNLDLTSTTPSVAPAAGQAPVAINVGGQVKMVNSSSSLTPSEYVAAQQVASSGRQTMQLSTAGAATGGYFITNAFIGNMNGLVLPTGVTAVQDFSANSFSLTGSFTNSGTFYALSTSSAVTTALMQASNITNNRGGLLTSVLPSGNPALSGFASAIPSLNLTLSATNQIVNNGTISSSGALNLIAGGSIGNGSASTNGTANAALLQAANGLSLSATSITNQGNIIASAGNLNILTNRLTNAATINAIAGSLDVKPLTGTILNVVNTNGVLAARDNANFQITGNGANFIGVSGGVIQSGTASFSAGNGGTISVDVMDMPAAVTVQGSAINFIVESGSSGLNATGFTNASSGNLSYTGVGDVQFDPFSTNGGSILVNTTGAITVNGPGNSPGNIDTSSGSGGSAGVVDLNTSGGSINVGNIHTGNNGNISLVAAQDVSARSINAQGTGGTSAAITVQAGGVANLQNVIAPGGSLSIGLENTNISGGVNIGSGSMHFDLPDTGSYTLDLNKITQYGGNSVSVGGANYHSDIIIKPGCDNCMGSVQSVSVRTEGKYVGTGSNLTLAETADFNITADGGVNTGSVKAGGVSFITKGALTVDGNLNGKEKVDLAGGDISVLAGTTTQATGGDVWMVSATNVNISSGSTIASYATTDGKSGGQIGIMAGTSDFDMAAQLASMQAARNGRELLTLPAGAAWDSSNVIKSAGGSNMVVQFPEGASKSISNSTFDLRGGVLFIDPPGSNNVTIDGANFIVVGPAVTGGGNNGGGNNGGGNNGGGSGSLGSVINSVVNANAANTATTLSNITTIDTSALTSLGSVITSTATSNDITSNSNNKNQLNADFDLTAAPADGSKGRPEPLRAAIYCAQPGKLKEGEAISEENWIIASNKCQPFSFETADGSIIVGTGPAIFAPTSNRTLLLKEGKLLVISGDSMIVVRTPMSNVTIPMNSAATVEFSHSGLTRVTGLAGGKASVSVTRQGETIILTAAAGEQLVLAEDSVPETEIACVPDVPNKKNDAWLVRLSGMRGNKFSFDRTEMVAREGLLNCTMGCFTKIQQSMIDQIRKSMMQEQNPTQLKSMLPPRQRFLISKANQAHLSAVGWGQVLDLTTPDLISLKCASAMVKYAPGAKITIAAPNQLDLRYGDVLVSTETATTVNAGKYKVSLQPHTIALINMRNDHVVVRNVFESKAGSIAVSSDDKKCIGAQLGHEIILGSTTMSFSSVLSEEAIGRRRMRHSELSDKTGLITSEVSLLSLLQNTNILSQMIRSEHPDDKAILAKVMKMACALSIATQRHGNYSIVGQ